MSNPLVVRLTTRLVVAGAITALCAGVAYAQKSRPAGPPPVTHGATKASDAAAKGQANADGKRTDADADKAANAADKKKDASERAALEAAHKQPEELLKDIKLTKDEKKSVDAIDKKYDAQLKTLDAQEDSLEKAGKSTAAMAAKITALRTQEQADLRAVLTPAQVTQFDKNASALASKH